MALLGQETTINPLFVGFCRMAIASPVLLLAASRTKGFWRWRSRRDGLVYLGLGACMATYQVCYFWAVPLAGVAVTALVAICSSPLFIALLAARQLGETLTRKVYAALGLGIVGTGLLVANPQAIAHHSTGFLLGVMLALGAGFSYAVYAVRAKASIATLEPLPVAAFSFTAAAFLLTPALLLKPTSTDALLISLPYLLYLGVVPTGLAYALYMVGLRRTPATIAGITVLLEPLTATLLGVLVFGESMGITGGVGVLLLLLAIALLTVPILPNGKPYRRALQKNR